MPSTAHSYFFVCAFLLFCVRILTFSYAHFYFFVSAFLLFRMRILTFSCAHSYFFVCAFLLFQHSFFNTSFSLGVCNLFYFCCFHVQVFGTIPVHEFQSFHTNIYTYIYLGTWSCFEAAKTAPWPSRGLHHCGKFLEPSDE